MSIKSLFGMKESDDDDAINITMANVTMPLDMALHLVFRQQQQIYQMLNHLQQQISVHDQVLTAVGEQQTQLHDYLIQLQTNIENATKHPVEKEDDVTEKEENKKDERPN